MSDSATLWIVAHQASLSMGFPRQEYWDLPDPGLEPVSLALVCGFLISEPPGKRYSIPYYKIGFVLYDFPQL